VWAEPAAEVVGVHVEGGDQVADAVPAGVGRAVTLRPFKRSPAAAVVRQKLTGPISSKLITTPLAGAGAVQLERLCGPRFVVRIRARIRLGWAGDTTIP
jgi:hypothetical protein